MLALELILRWLHIFGAIMLVGSTIFMRCVYVPAKLQSGQEPGPAFAERQRQLWARMVMLSSGTLLLSGLVSFVLIVKRYNFAEIFPGDMYHALFGVKFLLAMIVFFLAAALSGRSALAKRLRERERLWLMVNMVLAILVVCLGGVMKLAQRSEKPASAQLAPAVHVVVDSGEAAELGYRGGR
jgi:uncharacterized membrane protein